MICKFYLQFCGLPFHSIGIVPWSTNVSNVHKAIFYLYFFQLPAPLALCPGNHCQNQCLVLSFKSFSFSLLHLGLWSVFELTFVYHVRWGSNFIVLHVDIQFFSEPLLKRPSFFSLDSLATLIVKSFDRISEALFLDSLVYCSICLSLCQIFWFLKLCSTFWNQGVRVFQHCSFSILFWLFKVSWNSLWILV